MLMPEAIVSAATALGMTVTSLFQLVRVMRRFGLSRGEIAYHLAYGPALSGLTVIGAVSLAHSAAESFALPSGALGTAIELAIGVAVFGAVILLAFRTLSEPTVRAVADMIPGPFRTIFRRALLLGASHASVK